MRVSSPGDHKQEKLIHKKFKEYRIRGEWFMLGGAEMNNSGEVGGYLLGLISLTTWVRLPPPQPYIILRVMELIKGRR